MLFGAAKITGNFWAQKPGGMCQFYVKTYFHEVLKAEFDFYVCFVILKFVLLGANVGGYSLSIVREIRQSEVWFNELPHKNIKISSFKVKITISKHSIFLRKN